MMEEKSEWSTPTIREAPYWHPGMTEEEYDKERKYYGLNIKLVHEGKYKPLWKQRQEVLAQ